MNGSKHKWFSCTRSLTAAAILLAATVGCSALPHSGSTGSTAGSINFTYGNGAMCWLPTWVAVHDGLFKKVGLNVTATVHQGNTASVPAQVATGQYQFGTAAPGAALLNAPGQGFNIKVIFGMDQPKDGYASSEVIVVRSAQWRGWSLASLKKKGVVLGVENFPAGPEDVMIHTMLQAAGVKLSQLKTYNVNGVLVTPAQNIQLYAEGKIDVGGLFPPATDVAQEQGTTHNWLTYANVTPWYQDCVIIANGNFLAQHEDVAAKFDEALLMADRVIVRQTLSGHRYGPALAQVGASVTGFTRAQIALGVVPYVANWGSMISESLVRVQDVAVSDGVLASPTPADKVVSTFFDTRPLTSARKDLGIGDQPPVLQADIPDQPANSYPVGGR